MDSQKNIVMLKRKQVEGMTGLSRSSIYALMDKSRFPRAIKLSERSVGWLESEIQEWLKNRVSATREGGAL